MSFNKNNSIRQRTKETRHLINSLKKDNNQYNINDFTFLAVDCIEAAHKDHGPKRIVDLINSSRLIRKANKFATQEEKEKLKAVKLFKNASKKTRNAKSEKDVNSAINNLDNAIAITSKYPELENFTDMLTNYKEPFQKEASINAEKAKQKSLEKQQKNEQRKQKRANKRIARNEKAISKDNSKIKKSQRKQQGISEKLQETKNSIAALKGCVTGDISSSARTPRGNSRNKSKSKSR